MQIVCLASHLSLSLSFALIFNANNFKSAFERKYISFFQHLFFSHNKSEFFISLLNVLHYTYMQKCVKRDPFLLNFEATRIILREKNLIT